MVFFNANMIKCGKCGTEFDFNKNSNGCPLCGLGKKVAIPTKYKEGTITEEDTLASYVEYMSPPPDLKLRSGKIHPTEETKTWGSLMMFNDFFAPKFLARVTAWMLKDKDSDSILLSELVNKSVELILLHNLHSLKGFPSQIKKDETIRKDPAVGRLVYHFLFTAEHMGLFEANAIEPQAQNVWGEDWDKIEISLTKEGLEFAQLKNPVFDENKKEQVFSQEEKKWIVNYLKKIDKQGFKEYSVLKEVYDFMKKGHNGKDDLWNWFKHNKKYTDYIERISKRAKKNPDILEQQIDNYSKTFASVKVSLLRELGVVRNKRNDYTVVGEL